MQQVVVGLGTCGISAGGLKVYDRLQELLSPLQETVELTQTGCIGMCYREVLVEVVDDQQRHYLYGEVTPERAETIVEEHIVGGKPLSDWVVHGEIQSEDDSFFNKQQRIVLRNCGLMNPEDLEEYRAREGYQALQKALTSLSPEEVIDEILQSGLKGRGGAGFPTGLKWKFAYKAKSDKKYIICNADEGDPGAFMDRSVLEGDPYSVLEGMTLAGYAIGAHQAYIYVRAEYPLAVRRLRQTIAKAEEAGLLGQNILGSDFSFSIRLKEGAGAFVCGEETALMGSIEGMRGMPRVRPPFPAESGLFGYPTNINNVETFANVPWIIAHGAKAYADLGTENSKGTKVFALAGKVKRGGLVEVPMGLTINEIVFDICGGIKNDRQFKAVQMGGPSGGCIPASLGETPIDYERVNATGAIMGSGGMVVMDDETCMVDVARFFLEFTQNESCGKCTFCRVGTRRMLEILERITQGEGQLEDIQLLKDLAEHIRSTSLCGLGQTAPNPVLTTLRYFRDEYEDHIHHKKCPAKVCLPLVTFVINEECTGCMLCSRSCPSNAITGEKKKLHVIDQELCIKCGRCLTVCRFDAIDKR